MLNVEFLLFVEIEDSHKLFEVLAASLHELKRLLFKELHCVISVS